MYSYFIIFFSLGEHLHCYECNINGDTYDKNCETIDEKHKSDYLIKCPETGKKCGTIVTFGLYDFHYCKSLLA